jgi:hypothetical protein
MRRLLKLCFNSEIMPIIHFEPQPNFQIKKSIVQLELF